MSPSSSINRHFLPVASLTENAKATVLQTGSASRCKPKQKEVEQHIQNTIDRRKNLNHLTILAF